MKVSVKTKQWLEWVLVTSFPLRRFDASGKAVEFASGCLVDYYGQRFLLSVQHAVGMQSNGWVVDLGQTDRGDTEIYRPHSFNYVGEITRGTGQMKHIDFCYTQVPSDLNGVFQNATPRGIFDERPRHVFASDLSDLPSPNQVYAFSGEVKPERHGPNVMAFEKHVYPGLKFLRTEGEFHVFKLPVEHPGHDSFRGCSGAPIVDMNRKVVALVCNGNEDEGTIFGVSLNRYKFAFDFLSDRGHQTQQSTLPAGLRPPLSLDVRRALLGGTMTFDEFSTELYRVVKLGMVFENPGGGTSEVVSAQNGKISYRRKSSTMTITVESLYNAFAAHRNSRVSSRELRAKWPAIFDSQARPAGHSCNVTFLFLCLEQMGLVTQILGQGKAGKPFYVDIR